MTIEKGSEWGVVVDVHVGGVVASDDLAREIGVSTRKAEYSGPWRRLPLDTLVVLLTTKVGRVERHETAGWLVIGGRYRGEFCVVSSLSFVGGRRLFSRAHPNDGRLDWLSITPTMPLRQRIGFWRRTRTETHLPHPLVRTGTGVGFQRQFARPVRALFSDGTVIKRVVGVDVVTSPDSTHTHIPAQ